MLSCGVLIEKLFRIDLYDQSLYCLAVTVKQTKATSVRHRNYAQQEWGLGGFSCFVLFFSLKETNFYLRKDKMSDPQRVAENTATPV